MRKTFAILCMLAAPDGYTLGVASTSTHVVAPGVYARLEYDPIKDFAPVGLMAISPYLLAVNPALPANSLQELVALAKARPGKLNYASAGVGSTTHLAMEMLKHASGTFMLHIPYNGNGPAGTPQPIIERLNREIVSLVAAADTREAFDKAGTEPLTGTPADLAALIRDSVPKYTQIIKVAGVKAE